MHKRLIIAAILIFGLAALSAGNMLYPSRMETGTGKAASLPLVLGEWAGQDVEIEDYVKQILETDNIVQRNYVKLQASSEKVQMAIVYSANNRRVAHPPDICYKGEGWEKMAKGVIEPAGLPPMMRLLLAKGRGSRDIVYYCFKAGGELTPDYYTQQLNMIRNQMLRREETASALIRFSTHIGDNETDAQADARIQDLMRVMMPEIMKTLD